MPFAVSCNTTSLTPRTGENMKGLNSCPRPWAVPVHGLAESARPSVANPATLLYSAWCSVTLRALDPVALRRYPRCWVQPCAGYGFGGRVPPALLRLARQGLHCRSSASVCISPCFMRLLGVVPGLRFELRLARSPLGSGLCCHYIIPEYLGTQTSVAVWC